MPRLEGPTWQADVEWDKENRPVIYVTGRGRLTRPREMADVIGTEVRMVDAGPFQHVCVVYNVLETTGIPPVARMVGKSMPSTSRTAHIIVATNNRIIQLLGSLFAAVGNRRLRTIEFCTSVEQIEGAVKRWLALPDRTREYTIDNI